MKTENNRYTVKRGKYAPYIMDNELNREVCVYTAVFLLNKFAARNKDEIEKLNFYENAHIANKKLAISK